jgi:hypothetical protein
MTTDVTHEDPETYAPETRDQIIAVIYQHPIPRYQGRPKQAHGNIVQANDQLLAGLRIYFMLGRPPGDFLTGILKDSFIEAIGRADPTSLGIVKDLSTYVKNYPPMELWGDEDSFQHCVEGGGLVGHYGATLAWDKFCQRNL